MDYSGHYIIELEYMNETGETVLEGFLKQNQITYVPSTLSKADLTK
jgi:hypothetical protein